MKWTITKEEPGEMVTKAFIVIMFLPLFEIFNPLLYFPK